MSTVALARPAPMAPRVERPAANQVVMHHTVRILRCAVPAAEVVASNRAADAGGKHGRPQSWCIVREVPHVLLLAPLGLLNHEYYDPVSMARNDDFFHAEREARLRDYAVRGPVGGMPPIYLTFSGHQTGAQPRAFVANGNHRLEVAKRVGATAIAAWMPQADAQAWITSCASGSDQRTCGPQAVVAFI